MRVRDLIQQVRNTLQDVQAIRWTSEELLNYYNECKFAMASERLEDKTYATMALDPLQTEYNTTGILRYINAVDDEGNDRPLYADDGTGDNDSSGIIIINYNRVKVNDPDSGASIRFKIIAMPLEHTLDSIVRAGDEQAFKYYILSKAYEKETDTENFQKVDIFYGKYISALEKLIENSSVGYTIGETPTTKSYFF